MYCEKCGNRLADDARFCDTCGATVAGAAIGSPAAAADASGSSVITPEQLRAKWQQEAAARGSSTATSATVAAPIAAPVLPQVVQNSGSGKDGINKCPYCGASDIQLNTATGQLRCNYCHREWSEAADGLDFDIASLNGMTIGAGSEDINYDASSVVTLKCSACGAEVVIETDEAPQARCHWCRNTLSLNNQVPNGAIPDAVIPFRVTKEQAQGLIETFVHKRQFYAHPRFKAEFTTDNIMGAYLPYMVVDVNSHASLSGQAELLVRKYDRDKTTYYDADLYDISRDFDLLIDDLTLEASAEKLNQNTLVNSNNVINAILPYPLKETLRFNANYLRGFTSEKRDLNRDAVAGVAQAQVRDIARYQANQTALAYNRGIHWENINVGVKGQLWKSVYLPVWLYSYLEVKNNGKRFLHYVAVNGATGETMGSVPIHMPKLLLISAIIELIGCAIGIPLTIFLFLFVP
ncbi:MAG: hypothetical protein LBP28_01845 [Coriobacteriales bacterium]|jgi:hypothetical protein|nr:hypothetical protein [Coriobacteriales bacterium]